MHKKLTITLEEKVYRSLHTVIGRCNISQFIQSLIRSYVVDEDLESGYRDMARDREREGQAQQWAESANASALHNVHGSCILMHMRTTLNIDDELLRKAARLAGVEEKTALVKLGLEALIARESARRLANLGGTEKKL